jgi:RNA polymerase sigma-70 factor (ECF subfamily)
MTAFKMVQPTDVDLIERTLDGDGSAFGVIVDRFQRKVYRIVRAAVRDEMEADAITQDTFVQAYTHLASFERRSEFETWLTRIAINRCHDHLRKRKFLSLFTRTEDGEEMIEPADSRPDPEREMMSTQLRVAIRKAESLLSTQQKLIFRLRHYEDLSLEAIAQHLGLRSGTVRAHLFRAIQKIRKELSGWGRQPNHEHE